MPEILVQLFGLATIASAIRAFVPLYLATLGGIFNERSGIVNIGIDGMMIFGTWFGAWGALQWGPAAGLVTAVAAGVAVAAIHGMATITFRVDWINNAFIQSLPYIVTLVVLALFFRRVRPPKAVGQAYEAGSPV